MHAPRNGSRRCGRRLTALAARRSILAALLLAALAVLLALPAQAQTDNTPRSSHDVLVSNTAETAVGGSSNFLAQSFETGPNATGYTVTEIQVRVSTATSRSTLLTIREDDGGEPGALVATFINPASPTSQSLNTFTAPANTTLEASTTYWISLNEGISSSRMSYSATSGDDETGEMGWSIGNDRLWRGSETSNWEADTVNLVLAIKGTAAPPGPTAVPSDWSLIPAGLTSGDQFRLIFLSSTKRDGSATDIATYNAFIQTRAVAGHTDIQTYSDGFTVVGCTADVDARDNTGTTGVGVPIYWLNGAKVADDYPDFYDEDWDEERHNQNKNELGANGPNTGQSANYPFTGCQSNGTEDFGGSGESYGLGSSDNTVTVGRPNSSSSGHSPLWGSFTADTSIRPMYGLSVVFEVAAVGANIDATGKPAITGTAEVGQTLTASKGMIVDTNGTTKADNGDSGYAYTYQWVRVSGGTETAISGATGTTYMPVADDVGETIKVRASFTDDADNAEGPLTSDATAAVVEACDALWCATMTAGSSGTTVGFSDGTTGTFNAMGSLSPSQFRFEGAAITVNSLAYAGSSTDVDLSLEFTHSILGSSDYTLELNDESFLLSGTGGSGFFDVESLPARPNFGNGDTVAVKLFEGSGGVTLSDDATLTSLEFYAITHQDEELVTLTPAFDAGTTAYTAVVDYRFTTASMSKIVRGDSGASVVVTDEFASQDLGTGEDSVDDLELAIGENTITVEVTAADETTEIYTLVVTRTAPPPLPAHCETGDIWCATLTVASLSGGEFGYSGAQGTLSHVAFEHGGPFYLVETLSTNSASGVGIPLRIDFHPSGETVFNTDDLFLYIDGTAFAFSDATFSSGHFEWANSGLSWTVSDTVEVRLVEQSAPAVRVPTDWSLIPAGLSTGDQFRLIFLSSTKRDGTATDIATYNSFVQTRAAAGHTDIQAYSTWFSVVGCTADSDAIVNTGTTGGGVPIYWLNGAKVADHYADFYDGDWDEEAANKNELGANGPDTSQTANYPLTGCDDDGTVTYGAFGQSYGLGTSASVVTVGRPDSSDTGHGPIAGSLTDPATNHPMYGLSAVFGVGVEGANSDPTFPMSTADREVAENTAAGQDVGAVLTATDADMDTLTYTLEGTDQTSFDLVTTAGSAQIQTKTGVTYNYEVKSSYTVVVKADDGHGGTPARVTVTIEITDVDEPPDPPDAPMVTATAGSTTSLSVSWTEPATSGPDIDDYDLRYREGTSGGWSNGPQNVTDTLASIGSLDAGTSYQVQVRATNDEGNSNWSLSGSGTTADPAGVTISKSSLTVTEQDSSGDTYTVVLDSQPTADVTISVGGQSGTDVTAAPTPMIFTTTNWATPQTVTVTGDDDADLTNDMVSLTHNAASSDGDYDGIGIAGLTVTVNDNDTAQVTGVMIEPGNAQLVVEWTAVANATGYHVQWKSGGQGYNNSGRRATIASGSTTSHTISSLNNGTEYTVRVRATRTGASNGAYSSEALETPVMPTAAGVTISKSALTVTEQDSTGDSYTVVLDRQPTASVTVTVGGLGSSDLTANPSSLTFTTGNWATAQMVTVTAGNDADTTNDTVSLSHSAASTDTDYDGITGAGVTVTVNDNDTAQVMGVMITPGNAQLAVEWTAVANATGYEVQWKSGGQSYNTSGRQATISSGSTTSHTISSLTNGTEYTVRVRATRTGANNGAYSAEVLETPVMPTECDVLWCATLTVGQHPTSIAFTGFSTSFSISYGALTPNEFTRNGSPITVNSLTHDGTYLELFYTGDLSGSGYTLELGSRSFDFPDPDGDGFLDVQTGRGWSDGDTVEVKLSEATVMASDKATLQSLRVDYLIDEIITNNAPLAPAFSPDTTSYTAGVPSGVTVGILSAVATEAGAELVVTLPDGSTQEDTGDADEVYGDVSPGLNTFTVKVTAPDDITMKVYTVIVDRGGGLSGRIENLPSSHDGSTAFSVTLKFNTDISDDSIDNLAVAIGIKNGTKSDLAAVGSSKRNFTMTITPSSGDPVRILVRQTRDCSSSGHPICTAAGDALGQEIKRWVGKEDDARLSKLWLTTKDGTWLGGIGSDTYSYDGRHSFSELTMQAAPYAKGATAKLNVPEGATTWRVTVTSADGNETKTYRVTVRRGEGGGGPAADVRLKTLTVTPVNGTALSFTPGFHLGTEATTFRVRVSSGTTAVTVSVEKNSSDPEVRLMRTETVRLDAIDQDPDLAGVQFDLEMDRFDLELGRQNRYRSIWVIGPNARVEGHTAFNRRVYQLWITKVSASMATEAEPLMAAFENPPLSHDGSSEFTLRMAFSEDVEITPEDMRDHALTVLGGTVTAAEQVEGLKTLWDLTIQPSGNGSVFILTPLNRACTEAGALCTADGGTLTVAPGLQIAGPPPPQVNNPATGVPTVTGTAQVGETLSADTSAIADADGLANVSFSYQWIRNDGSSDTDITGATDSTYSLDDADEGKTIKVKVGFTDDAGSDESLASAATGSVAARPDQGSAPDTPDRPVGTAVFVGGVDLEWNDVPGADSYDVQLFRNGQWMGLPGDGVEITFYGAGAIISELDPGSTHWFQVRARNAHGSSDWSNFRQVGSTNQTTLGKRARPDNVTASGAPVINGTAQVGESLTADTTGIEDGNGLDRVQFRFQWVTNDGSADADITGATDSTYTLVAADEGKTVKVRVPFTDRGGYAESLTSDATDTVSFAVQQQTANSPATGAPAISGTAQVGETLTAATSGIADSDGLSNVTYSYQWVANDGTNDTDISGATGSTYTLVAADEGNTVKVKVSFTDDADNGETLTSAATAAVDAAPNSPATGAPAITGAAQVGETLTADTSGIADADGLTSVSYSYQWIRNDGSSDSDIQNATGSSYTLVAADEGKTIKVRMSFTDDAGYGETLTSAATAAVDAEPNSPATGAPTITGTAQVGETLTADTSTIADADGLDTATFTYQWVANDGTSDTDIAGATGSSYTLVTGDQGKTIRVRVSFTDDAGNHETLTGAATAAVDAAPNSPATGAPTITGAAQVGETLTADTSGIADADGLTSVSYSYQWIRNDGSSDSDIQNATGSSYTLVAADEGKTIKVRMSFTDDAGHGETLTSAATAAVDAAPNSPATGAPTITGTAQVGQTLTADTSAIADADGLDTATFTYQWVANDGTSDTDIAGATGSTYTLAAADEGGTIKVKVSFNDDADNGETLTSPATAAVDAAPNNPATGAPSITGTAQVGETLSADTSAIADADGLTNVSYSYQWVANDGSSDSDITSATDSTYSLDDADEGRTIKVKVGFTDDAGSDESLASAATASVAARPNQGSAPDTPDRPVGTAVFAGGVDLEWNDVPGADSYDVQLFRNGQWMDLPGDGVEIAFYGAGAIISELDPGSTHWFQVRARNAHGSSDWSNYRQVGSTNQDPLGKRARPDNVTASGAPVINGTAQVGESLTADAAGIEDGNGLDRVQFRFQWVSNDGSADAGITGATDSTYTLVAADEGKTVKVRVSLTDRGGYAESLTSAATDSVSFAVQQQVANSPATGAPAISGTAQVGETLTGDTSAVADADGLSNVTYSYQWVANDGTNDTDISGATGSTYTLVAADEGKTIKVRVSFTDDADNEETLTGAATAAVDAAPNSPATGAPAITGTAQVGETLTADTSGIADADGLSNVSYSYQWIRNDGSSDSDITSATGSSYTLAADDEGRTIKVKVSFTDDADNGETLTSAATAAVDAEPNSPATGTPTITGTAQVGQTLTADTSAIADADGLTNVSYSYQWIANDGTSDSDISGGTDSTYTLAAADEGGTIKVKVSFTDDADNGETLTSPATAAVDAAPNSPATGAPTITGTAQVGQTLTADTSAIADADGLTNVSYSYQWIRNDGSSDTDIQDATDSTYSLVDADEGKTIKVRVSFTDDAGHGETLNSAATGIVAAALLPLTVSLENNPATHNGTDAFTFEIRFSEEFPLSFRTLKFHALQVTGGTVKKALRVDDSSDIHWRITVRPDADGNVTIVLPVTDDCDDQGAICTGDGRKLSNSLEFTVAGPGG